MKNGRARPSSLAVRLRDPQCLRSVIGMLYTQVLSRPSACSEISHSQLRAYFRGTRPPRFVLYNLTMDQYSNASLAFFLFCTCAAVPDQSLMDCQMNLDILLGSSHLSPISHTGEVLCTARVQPGSTVSRTVFISLSFPFDLEVALIAQGSAPKSAWSPIGTNHFSAVSQPRIWPFPMRMCFLIVLGSWR